MATSAVFQAPGRRPASLKRRLGVAVRLFIVLVPVVLLIAGIFWLFSFLFSFTQQGMTMLPVRRPMEVVLDPGHLLPEREKNQMSHQIAALNHSMQADWMLVIVPQLDPRQSHEVAEKLFARWQLGKRSLNQRGALLLVSARPQKATLVLGPDLNHAFGKMAGGDLGDFLQTHLLRLYLDRQPLSEGLLAALSVMNHQFNPSLAFSPSAIPESALAPERPTSLVLPPAE